MREEVVALPASFSRNKKGCGAFNNAVQGPATGLFREV
jgi:hypothetical protein